MRNLIAFMGCILYIVLVSCKRDKQLIEDMDEEQEKTRISEP